MKDGNYRKRIAARVIQTMWLLAPFSMLAADPVLVGQWPAGNRGPVQAVTVQDGLAYCALGSGGLGIYNVTNAADPFWIGGLNAITSAVDVAVAGNYAFVALGRGGLHIVDVSNPTQPVSVSTYTNCDVVKAIAVSGNHALLADGTNGLRLLNVSVPTSPVAAGSFSRTNGFGEGVTVSNNLAAIALGAAGVYFVDISNPSALVALGSNDTPGYARSVALANDHAFVADGNFGARAISISNPANPIHVGGYDTPGFAQKIVVTNGFAFVADCDGGLQILDVQNPANVVFTNAYEGGDWITSVSVSGNYVYAAAGANLEIVDVSSPGFPVKTVACNTGGDAVDVAVSGTQAYVADSLSGTHVIDISNPSSLFRLAEVGKWAFSTTIWDDLVYASVEQAGLQIFDPVNPASPLLIGESETDGFAMAVARMGNFAAVANRNTGLRLLDASLPTNLVPVGAYSSTTYDVAYDVAVAGTRAYLVAGNTLRVIDLSTLTQPVLLGSCTITGRAESVIVSGSYAYVAAWTSGLQIIDVSNPAAPTNVGGVLTGGQASGLALVGDLIYVADGTNGLSVIHMSGPTNLVRVGGCDTDGFAEKVAITGNYACVADGPAGVKMFQIYGFAGDPPRFVATPQSQFAMLGENVAFSVLAQGEPSLHYQWRLDGVDIPGETSTSLVLPSVSEIDVGGYSVVVSNAHDTMTSPEATLELLHTPQLRQPSLVAVNATTNRFQFEFDTQPGVNYLVEFKDDLNLPWQLLRFVASDSAFSTVTHQSAKTASRFYQIRIP